MTLIVTSFACGEAIVVADRRLTDANGRIGTDRTYKLLNYVNPDQGYRCVVGFTGLTTFGSFRTIDWLATVLPSTLTPTIPLYDGLLLFTTACTERFARIRPPDPVWKRTLFLLSGWQQFITVPPHSERFSIPFTAMVGNSINENGEQNHNRPGDFILAFKRPAMEQARSYPQFARQYSDQFYRGDIVAASHCQQEWIEACRKLRECIPYTAKIRLITDFIRNVADVRVPNRTNSVGRDLLSMMLPADDGFAMGGDWHEDTSDPTMTMPNFLSASGGYMTNFSVSPLPDTSDG